MEICYGSPMMNDSVADPKANQRGGEEDGNWSPHWQIIVSVPYDYFLSTE